MRRRWWRWVLGLAVAMLAVVVAAPRIVAAQVAADRYELGLRLRAFEAAFDADGADRRAALPALQQAVGAFFTFRLGEAGGALDGARWALHGPPTDEAVAAAALTSRPAARLIDPAAGPLAVRIDRLYDAPDLADAAVRLAWIAGGRMLAETAAPLTVPSEPRLDLGNASGDGLLRTTIVAGGRTAAEWDQTVSVVGDLSARLKAIADAAEAAPNTSAGATLRHLDGVLAALAAGQTLETDYPAARLLAEAEALAAGGDVDAGPGDHYLALAVADGPAPVRLMVPDGDGPWPLVIALHGAGGSENLFFDGYGRGRIVELCRERGWLLVSPRAGRHGVVDLIDAVDALAAVDRRRVALVGHSMGAMLAVATVSEAPERFAAVVALGGGGRPTPSDALRRVPFGIWAGEADFALDGARGLAATLREAGVATVEFGEVADCEHLTVVQAALPTAFEFLDQRLR